MSLLKSVPLSVLGLSSALPAFAVEPFQAIRTRNDPMWRPAAFVCDTTDRAMAVVTDGDLIRVFEGNKSGWVAPPSRTASWHSAKDLGCGLGFCVWNAGAGANFVLRQRSMGLVENETISGGSLTVKGASSGNGQFTCRSEPLAVVQCITAKRSIYVIKSDGKYSYMANDHGKSGTFKLSNGRYSFENEPGQSRHLYTFRNGNYRYVVRAADARQDYLGGWVEVYQGQKQILSEACDLYQLGTHAP